MTEHEDDGPDIGGAVVAKPKQNVKKPSMYRVILHNDDYTPMEFVVMILEKFFQKDTQSATKIMMDVHQKGHGICGVYPLDVAETKVAQVRESAKAYKYPLKCTTEKDS